MLTQTEAIKLIREQYNYLSLEYGVKQIGFFGSLVRDEITEDSDVDIIVELKDPVGFKFLKMIDYLEKLLGTKVDVLTTAGLDNIRIKNVGEGIKRNIVYV